MTLMRRFFVELALLILVAIPAAAAVPTWTTTGSLNVGREFSTLTLLTNGQVLITGGRYDHNLTTAEIYNPATGVWTQTTSLPLALSQYSTTLLANGKVLVAGGVDNVSDEDVATALLYDPATSQWTQTGTMHTKRSGHSATLLSNGMVLVAGAQDSSNNDTPDCELYDPNSGTWSTTGSMVIVQRSHTAVLLGNGQVLVSGGITGATTPMNAAQIYDPTTGVWTQTGSMTQARSDYPAVLLPNGQVLVEGGGNINTTGPGSSELYTVSTGKWTKTGEMVTPRYAHTATLLGNGKVLVAGGLDYGNTFQTTAELFNPATQTWASTASLKVEHSEQGAVVLNSGLLLLAGDANFSTDAELYNSGEASQTITFHAISGQVLGVAPFTVSATSSSGLPVAFSIVSGPATISGNTITLLGDGPVVVAASAPGNSTYFPVSDITQSFQVTSVAVPYAAWQNTYATGGPATVTENGGVSNLFKYLCHLNPTLPLNSADFAALPHVSIDTTTTPGTSYLVLKYRQSASETGVTVGLETSSDLQTWMPVTPDISKPVSADPITHDPIVEIGVKPTGAHEVIRLSATGS